MYIKRVQYDVEDVNMTKREQSVHIGCVKVRDHNIVDSQLELFECAAYIISFKKTG